MIRWWRKTEPPFTPAHGEKDARLRVIFDNGTESDLLRRSLRRALNKDVAGRVVTEPPRGLFAETFADEAPVTGTLYVLRSESEHPFIAANRTVVHKIGVTTGSVAARLSGAEAQATYLLAPVKVVAEYRLQGVRPHGLENLLHRVFEEARLNLELPDRFGRPFRPREWFLVPLSAIDEAISAIRAGTLAGLRYEKSTGVFVPRSS